MIIYIARHGQTDINAEHRAQGRKSGKPLNTIGVKQAMELGEKFKKENIEFDYIFSSPQERVFLMKKC